MIELVGQQHWQDWLDARKELITGSDVASLLCESYAKTETERLQQRAQLIMRKAGLAEEWQGNENTELSGALEPTVIAIAAKRWNLDLQPYGKLVRDSECERLGATPDSLFRGRIPVNVKVSSCTPQEDIKPKKDGSPSEAAFANGIPLYYRLQLLAEMAVMDASHGGLLVLHYARELKLRLYIQPRRDDVIARIRSEVTRAWEEIEALRAGRMKVAS